MSTVVAALIAGLLTVGTAIGIVTAINDTSPDRGATSTSNAPVYGTP